MGPFRDKILWYKLRVQLFTSKLLLIFFLIRLNYIPWLQQHSVKFFLVHTGNNWWYYNFSDVLQTFIFLWHRFKKSGRRRQRYLKKYVKYVKQQYFCCFSTFSCIKSKFCWLHPNSLCCSILASIVVWCCLLKTKISPIMWLQI